MVSTLANASNERWLLHLNPSLRKARLSLATSHSRSKLHFRNCICRLRIGGGNFAKGQLYRLTNVGRYPSTTKKSLPKPSRLWVLRARHYLFGASDPRRVDAATLGH
ncbi:hypothetical protein DSM14862_03766 (plasmid) [Sulfitobacter indolifex]|nr:hypothetical protein DSM14862_03341 [Sulfitobacter indolifex]UOA20928.1 hypothetical protein DSM14862_03766 [Sulfitobacter indolifex]